MMLRDIEEVYTSQVSVNLSFGHIGSDPLLGHYIFRILQDGTVIHKSELKMISEHDALKVMPKSVIKVYLKHKP